jgi:hypothetical protein
MWYSVVLDEHREVQWWIGPEQQKLNMDWAMGRDLVTNNPSSVVSTIIGVSDSSDDLASDVSGFHRGEMCTTKTGSSSDFEKRW